MLKRSRRTSITDHLENKLLDIPLLENRTKVREDFTDRDSRMGEGDILGFYYLQY